jgi:hypothetical protein
MPNDTTNAPQTIRYAVEVGQNLTTALAHMRAALNPTSDNRHFAGPAELEDYVGRELAAAYKSTLEALETMRGLVPASLIQSALQSALEREYAGR